MPDLGTDEHGRDIVGVGIIIRNTGDGLSKAMNADPTMALNLRQGDKVYVVLEADVVDIHSPVEDPKYPDVGGVRKVPVLKAGTATLVDDDAALARIIAAQADRNRKHADAQSGQQSISEAILLAEHDDGKHRKLVAACPKCDEEREAAALEAAEGGATADVS